MKLTVINGSPRGRSSNTKVLLDRLLEGFRSVENGYTISEIYLKGGKKHSAAVEALSDSDIVIIAFPLYTDAMPGIVKEFIEAIDLDTFSNPTLRLGFLVQSGFPEGHHTTFIRRYLDKLAGRLGIRYLGTIIKGGVEGIKIQPRWMTRFIDLFYDLGQHLALENEFHPVILTRLSRPVHMSRGKRLVYSILNRFGLTNYYWNYQLKENKAYPFRYARPYYQS